MEKVTHLFWEPAYWVYLFLRSMHNFYVHIVIGISRVGRNKVNKGKLTEILFREVKLFFDITQILEIGSNLKKNAATWKTFGLQDQRLSNTCNKHKNSFWWSSSIFF